MIKQIFTKIPKLPFSALIFYLSILLLWKGGYIPHPANVLIFLENLYTSYGLAGLFIASFLEGIVYFGLYFPGSFIVALAVILSDGTFASLFMISLVVAIALTITSTINFVLGRKIAGRQIKKEFLTKEKQVLSKGLFISMLHPNVLAFYFFDSGIKKQNLAKIFAVPFIMIPYGLLLGYLFYSIKEPLKRAIESPYIMISVILVWIIISFLVEAKKRKKRTA